MNSSIIDAIIGGVITLIGTGIFYLVVLGRKFEKIDRLEEEQKDHKSRISEIDKEIATLKEFKANTQKYIDAKLYESKSPLTLTELGKQLIEESGFNGVFEKEKDNLIEMLKKKDPKTQYDVQEMARELMNELVGYEPFQSIKKYAFDHGKDYAQILRAGAIPLRDYYLEKHPEITE